MPTEKLLNLIGLLYDAAAEPEHWPVFLQRFADSVKGTATVLMIHDLASAEGCVSLSTRLDPSFRKLYDEHYHNVNILAVRAAPLMMSEAAAIEQNYISDQELLSSEYYNDFLRPQDLGHDLTGVITREQSRFAMISTNRPRRMKPFSNTDLKLLEHLLPHLKRATKIHGMMQKAHTSTAVLDELTTGVFILNARSKLLFMNRAALRMIGQHDGLSCNTGGLDVLRQQERTRIRRLMQDACHTAVAGGTGSGGTMLVTRPSGKRPYTLQVSPFRSQTYGTSKEQPAAVVFATDPEILEESAVHLICREYRLTPAEARLAAAIVEGNTVEEAADICGVRKTTVRTHLAHIGHKLGVRRQSEVVSAILRALVPVSRPE